MSLSLLQTQQLFSKMSIQLIQYANQLGYDVTLGEAWRPEITAEFYAQQGTGIAHSLHTQRLAIDLNLFKDGLFLTEMSDYLPLGEYWESIATPDAPTRWGGRFRDVKGNPKPDADHFSIAWGGEA